MSYLKKATGGMFINKDGRQLKFKYVATEQITIILRSSVEPNKLQLGYLMEHTTSS